MTIQVATRTLALMLCAGAGAGAATAQPAPAPDTVENGVVALKIAKLNGLPLFDRRSSVSAVQATESARWLMARVVKDNASVLQNVQTAKRAALMFVPVAAMDRYLICNTGATTSCAKAFAGTTAAQRAAETQYTVQFRGNEFEAARAHQDFVQAFGERIGAIAPAMPQEAYIAVNNSLAPYSAAEGGYRFIGSTSFSSGGAIGEIGLLNSGVCAPTTAVFPNSLKLNSRDAEELANRIDSTKRNKGDPSRYVTMVLKIRIEGLRAGGERCAWEVKPVKLDLYPSPNLTGPLVEELPFENVALPVAKAAPPLRAERPAPATPPPRAEPRPRDTPPVADAPSNPPPTAPAAAAKESGGGRAGSGNLTDLPRREAAASAGPDIVGIRLGQSMAEAEKIAREHLKPELVYELSSDGPSTGYPKGIALVSLKLGEALFVYTGDVTPGKVNGIERAVIADNVDVRQIQEQYRARYMVRGGVPGLGKSTGTECSVAFNAPTKPALKLVSGKAPGDAEQSRALTRLLNTGRRLNAHPLPLGKDRSSCGPGIYLNTGSTSNPMLLFTIWDHSRASFDPEPPKRALKL